MSHVHDLRPTFKVKKSKVNLQGRGDDILWRSPTQLAIDGTWPISVFTSKQVFGPRSAKSKPIWIKFCTHLLLYEIHLWAD